MARPTLTLRQRLDCIRWLCLLDHNEHRHDVPDLVRRGLAWDDGKQLPRLTAAGLEAYRDPTWTAQPGDGGGQ